MKHRTDPDAKTMQKAAENMRQSDIDQGHVGADVQWGRYEVLARTAFETLKEPLAGTSGEAVLKDILEWKV